MKLINVTYIVRPKTAVPSRRQKISVDLTTEFIADLALETLTLAGVYFVGLNGTISACGTGCRSGKLISHEFLTRLLHRHADFGRWDENLTWTAARVPLIAVNLMMSRLIAKCLRGERAA